MQALMNTIKEKSLSFFYKTRTDEFLKEIQVFPLIDSPNFKNVDIVNGSIQRYENPNGFNLISKDMNGEIEFIIENQNEVIATWFYKNNEETKEIEVSTTVKDMSKFQEAISVLKPISEQIYDSYKEIKTIQKQE